MQIITWLVAAMLTFAPARETERARYADIARDLVDVAFDPSEPPLFSGESGRARTVLLLASIAAHESTFRKDVEAGHVRGDSGRSWCLMQINVGTGKTVEGWTGEELVADRQKCFRAALHLARWSFGHCRGLPIFEKLAAYASGSCGTSAESRQMVTRAIAFFRRHETTDRASRFIETSTPWIVEVNATANRD